MNGTGGGNKYPDFTVGNVHTMVRDKFVSKGLGATTLSKVEADHPDLMKRQATLSNMGELVTIENRRVKAGPLQSPGDWLARGATPVRRAFAHMVMAQATHGRYGVKGLVQDKNEYGMQTFSNIISGTF